MKCRAGLLGALFATVVAACSAGGGSESIAPVTAQSKDAPATDLTVYAAASLKTALARAIPAYEAEHKGTNLTISTDSSAALETQIEQGAPADVFLSADTANPQKLADRGLASGGPVPFAGNQLAVVVPQANRAGIATPADLAKPGIKVIAAADAVPIAKYANQLVANLARQPGYPSDFSTRYAANVVSKEDNVAAVVSKIELGEGDAAICYVTDAKAAADVRTIAVPAAANVPATYAGVVVKASKHLAAAETFLRWLAGSDGQAILGSFGFLPPS